MPKLEELFYIKYGHSLELNRLKVTSPENGIPFISRKMGDNGVSAYVEKLRDIEPNPAGELTCALSGNGVLTTSIQERPYYTGFHIACLRPKMEMTTNEMLYYSICIRLNRYRYGWGRQANRTLKDLMVPEIKEIPDWVNECSLEMFKDADKPKEIFEHEILEIDKWKFFKISDLFDIKKGKRLTKADMNPGNTPFIAAIDNNNGVRDFISQLPIHEGNTITVNYNGSVAEAFYQEKPYRCSDDVNVLYPKFEMTPEIAMFIITLIRFEKYRFNYGRKWHLERMEQSNIKLPVALNGNPDFEFMGNYIKSLSFSSQL